MPINSNNASLELAKRLTDTVTAAMESGEMLDRVTPTTRTLLEYWFGAAHCEQRQRNFHIGQRQAILNIIYLHEIIGEHKVADAYEYIAPDLVPLLDLATMAHEKYACPRYAVKMATGTGKTWVMHALLLWQLLNARHEEVASGRFTQRFLIVAPGLIVYDRLLDAFCGRMERGHNMRNIETNDFYFNQELFIPQQYRQKVFSFIQNNTVTKDEGIGRKTTGDGMIALTNWHLFENQLKDDEAEDGDTPPDIVHDLLPVRPGKAAGNDLSVLDRRRQRGEELEYLASLDDIMVINDEAHHIHELKRGGEVEEVEWQRGLNTIAATKGERFMQVDFSATPFDTRGAGKKQVKCFFPHIVVDFNLASAMRMGLVKTLLLDRRQELTDLEHLDFHAVRDERGKVCGLSEGQRLMLRAGLTKLKKLEADFIGVDKTKNPKMLVMCEDTTVSPFVEEFLKDEGLANEDVVSIDSNAKGEVSDAEWKETKAKLFDIDRYPTPKVIVSVLMLREGFDVNNICVIVPLRSSQAPILLEQTIGRGLRLMWRDPEYRDIKDEDRKRVLALHKNPTTYLDMLSIIEHPAFVAFYDQLFADSLAAVDAGDVGSEGSVGDIIKVGLKEGYEDYDFMWPIVLREAEDELSATEIDIATLEPFTMFPLSMLRKFLATEGETFVSQEATTKTQFGQYKVTADLFTANSYNEYLQKMLHTITNRFDRLTAHKEIRLPNLQINEAQVVGTVDTYIRTRLFGEPFNPFASNDWKILLAKNGVVTKHVVRELARAIFALQNEVTTIDAKVEQIYFSSVAEIKMRESFSIPQQKTIYERTSYPSHRGGFERAFAEFLDKDAGVERFLKINETYHSFAIIYYVRQDGLMASYHPDFIVGTENKIYLIETKGQDKLFDQNVRQKQTATVEWTHRINGLPAESRMNRVWEYVLLSEDNFYSLSGSRASLTEICDRYRVSLSAAMGDLFA
ncbi:MAG: DEAD/DEAH box helicase family protein [Prevotella sp.]|nr:DEAD/DEAH box helicase family protein [Prevotella sp.]